MRTVFYAVILLSLAATGSSQPFLRVKYTPGSGVAELSWTPPSGAVGYDVRRATVYPNWEGPVSAQGLTMNYPVLANTAYVFRIEPYGPNHQPMTPSNVALVTTQPFSATPLVDIRAQFLSELRSMVDAARVAAGVPPNPWSRPIPVAGTPIYKEYFSEVRSGINGALENLGYTSLSPYTDPVLSSAIGIKKIQVEEMRTRVRAYPEWITAGTFTRTEAYFSPNADGIKDTNVITAVMSATAIVRWQLNIRNASNQIVRSEVGTGSSFQFVWDGRDGSGVMLADGQYSLELFDREANVVLGSLSTVLDNTPPAVAIDNPANGAVLSNVRQSGSTVVSITGRVTDAYLSTWTLDVNGAALPTGNQPVPPGSQIASWDTPLSNGTQTLHLTANDFAGNVGVVNRTVDVQNFSAAQDRYQMNVGTGEKTTYTLTRPSFPITAELRISAMNGVLLKTIPVTAAASYEWDGHTDAGGIVGNGAYQYTVSLHDDANPANTMIWNDNVPLASSATQCPYAFCRNTSGDLVRCDSGGPFDFDPYANKPLRITFCVAAGSPACVAAPSEAYACTASNYPAYVYVKAVSSGETNGNCDVDCIWAGYLPGGRADITWYGLNIAGSYIAGRSNMAVIRHRELVNRNMTVVYNSGPSLDNVAIAPIMFNPAFGAQAYTVTVSSSSAATIALEMKNNSSGAILRHISQSVPGSGIYTLTWDGRSDAFGSDGPMFVAPGLYETTVIVTDASGRQARLSPLVTVQY